MVIRLADGNFAQTECHSQLLSSEHLVLTSFYFSQEI